jgi:hypothetical protein
MLTAASSSLAWADDKPESTSASVDTVAAAKPAAAESVQAASQPEPSESYDDFVDENRNGVDDRYEKEAKQKVKVQRMQQKPKPTRGTEPEKNSGGG